MGEEYEEMVSPGASLSAASLASELTDQQPEHSAGSCRLGDDGCMCWSGHDHCVQWVKPNEAATATKSSAATEAKPRATHTPGLRLYIACSKAFHYTRGWGAGSPAQHQKYERAAAAFIASDPLLNTAPELLEALKALQLQALQSPDLIRTEWGCEALDAARTAIAKATGEQP